MKGNIKNKKIYSEKEFAAILKEIRSQFASLIKK